MIAGPRPARIEEVLDGLERARRSGVPREIEPLLRAAAAAEPQDPEELIRLHEALLFHRAYPRSKNAVALAERALARIPAQVARLGREGFEMEAFDAYEAAGVGGTTVSMTFTYDVVRQLVARAPDALSIDWDVHDAPEALERVLPRLFPLVAEEALADVGVDYRAWLDAARPKRERELPWLVARFEDLVEDERNKALLYDALQLQLSWRLGASDASRTKARWPYRPFLMEREFARKHGVRLADEFARAPKAKRLTRAAGERALGLCRAAVLVRYRELYAFTYGDPASVREFDLGRGASALVCGVVPGRRLPLRAGFGYLLLRNGVPVGYGDAYALGPKLDLSFNVFYSYRDGESAFLYARVAAAFRALLGVRVLRADPYQVGGAGNEEGIASGALFFYRKLGFASSDPRLEALARAESEHRAKDPERRTPAGRLRSMASAAVLWAERADDVARWSRFSVRAFAARAMAGDAETQRLVKRFERLKAEREEAGYARALAADPRLEEALLRLGAE